MKKYDIWVIRYGKEWALRWAGNTKVIKNSLHKSKRDAVSEARTLTSGKIAIQLKDKHYKQV